MGRLWLSYQMPLQTGLLERLQEAIALVYPSCHLGGRPLYFLPGLLAQTNLGAAGTELRDDRAVEHARL